MREFAEKDPISFLRQHPEGMFIDEMKQEGEITAIEVKSSMTYHPSFEKHIAKLSEWIKTPIRKKIIVYSGDFENTAADIKIVNYKNIHSLL